MALSRASQEGVWLRYLLEEIDPSAITEPTKIHGDNKGAVDLAKSGGYRRRTKHIDGRHHFLRSLIKEKRISIIKVSTEDMMADALTKALPRPKFERCIAPMGQRK